MGPRGQGFGMANATMCTEIPYYTADDIYRQTG